MKWEKGNHIHDFLERIKSLEGAGLVASEKFLKRLSGSLETSDFLVDYGAGIGTVSSFALTLNPKMNVLAVEENDWCRNQFTKNVKGISSEQVTLVSSLNEVSWERFPKNALWVIDTEQTPDDIQRIFDSSFKSIWIEGHRFNQRQQILSMALEQGLSLKYISFLGGARSAKGGCEIVNLRTPGSVLRKVLMNVSILRILITVSTKLNIIEWEMRSRIAELLKERK